LIEVVGRACRLPGANGVREFWKLLLDGQCSVSKVPSERFAQDWYSNPRRGEPGKAYTFAAGVVDDIWGFDPAVFSITPREARQMDPQQRLILQLAWEALEDAGISPLDLSGRKIGVYMGASSMDHSHRQYFDPAGTDSYLMTGNTLSLIANRISYIFDLNGPSLTVDTACSSSLVALDYALQDLNSGRADAAIVGGVNALLSPFNFMGFCAASMLSPDGLCRPFDHRANGYVRSEGGVVMVLQRAENPLTSKRSHGEILASAMNCDGRTSGVALPSSAQQAALLDRIYSEAQINPKHLAFVEAHGTGTMVGDPAEATAIGNALGRKRRQPLPIGSAKSNIGHLEPASGLVGLLKAQLALEHGIYPPTLHVEKLNPYIPFDDLNLEVATAAVQLKVGEDDALAGVNNFGFGGTNVHVVIRGGQRHRDRKPNHKLHKLNGTSLDDKEPSVLMLSAQCSGALSSLVQKHHDLLVNPTEMSGSISPRDLASATAHYRAHMRERVAIVARDRAELLAGLDAAAAGVAAPNVITGTAVPRSAKVAFVFSGNGVQWDGMGRIAHHQSPTFRRHFNEVDKRYQELTQTSLQSLLFADDLAEQLRRTEIAQPLLFAIQVAIARSLMEQGLTPDAVLGHSVGEVAAAHIAGALTLDRAVTVVRARSHHQELAHGLGRMAALNISDKETCALIAESGIPISVAAINSTRSVTVAGSEDDIRRFMEFSRKRHVAGRLLDIEYPFHSALLDDVREPLLASLDGLTPRALKQPMYSTVTGAVLGGREMTAEYWWHNVRDPVQFLPAVSSAARDGCQVFVEIGPRSILRNYLIDILSSHDADTAVVSTFERNDPVDLDPVRVALARALVAGANCHIEQTFGAPPSKDIPLPSYPWQNREFRLNPSSEALNTITTSHPAHALLGMQLRPDDWLWESQIDTCVVPFLADHKVSNKPIMPGSAYVEMALVAARHAVKSDRVELRDVDFVQALELSSDQCKDLRTRIDAEGTTVIISSRTRLSTEERHPHMRARYGRIPTADCPQLQSPAATRTANVGPDQRVYRIAEKFSLNYGPAFQRVIECREIGDDIIEVELSPAAPEQPANFLLHPVDFDACFHGLNVIFERLVFGENKLSYVPVRIGSLRVFSSYNRVRTARIRLSSYSTRAACASFELFAADGVLIAIADEVRFKAAALVQRHKLEQTAYHIHHHIEPLGAAKHQSPAPRLAEVLDRLRSSSSDVPDEILRKHSENEMLIDLASRRIAWDVLGCLATHDGSVDLDQLLDSANGSTEERNPGHLSNERRSAAALLLNILLASDLAEMDNGSWRIRQECPIPVAQELVNEVMRSDPAWAAECMMLLRAQNALSDWLLKPSANDIPNEPIRGLFSSGTLEHFHCSSPRARSRIDTVMNAMRLAISSWPADRPLRILQLGVAGGGLTRALVGLLSRPGTSVLVADTDERWISRIANLWTRQPGLATVVIDGTLDGLKSHGPFDMVVSANGLHLIDRIDDVLGQLGDALASNAVVIVSEAKPDAFHDLVFCTMPGWLIASDTSRGRLRDAEAWKDCLKAAGFATTVVSEGEAEKSNGYLLLGQTSAQPLALPVTEQSEPRSAVVVLTHDSSVDVYDLVPALREQGLDPIVIDPSGSDLITKLVNASAASPKPIDIIYASHAGSTSPDSDHLQALGLRVSELTGVLNAARGIQARLWVVAVGGARNIADLGASCPVQSGVWSFGRTAMNEFGSLDIRMVDADQALAPSEVGPCLATLLSDPGNVRELILRSQSIHALDVRRGLPISIASTVTVASP